MQKDRYYIEIEGTGEETYKWAIKMAIVSALNDKKVNHITLIVPTKNNTDILAKIYGSKGLVQLFAGMKLGEGKPLLKLETLKTYKEKFTSSQIIIACDLDADDVFKIKESASIVCIVAISGLQQRLEKWVKTWQPLELKGNQDRIKSYDLPSCIVQVAMQALVTTINTASDNFHSDDEVLAKNYLLSLNRYEKSLKPESIFRFLKRELDLKFSLPNQIENWVKILNAGKGLRGSEKTRLLERYEIWQAQCEAQMISQQ